mmetsp:Transcript_16259/g.32950  ORF Transcript_16259/g.32950 Transcript_16259/m.32950 type:complete len:101 (+) Transcript_16259:1447-1749(+)
MLASILYRYHGSPDERASKQLCRCLSGPDDQKFEELRGEGGRRMRKARGVQFFCEALAGETTAAPCQEKAEGIPSLLRLIRTELRLPTPPAEFRLFISVA